MNWVFWLAIFLLAIFLIWLFFGGQTHEFVGMRPINDINDDITRYIPDSYVTYITPNYENPERSSTEESSDSEERKKTRKKEKKFISFSSKAEQMCCKIMEQIYDKPFTRVRPPFLKNPETGYPLEIDCYNAELKIGVEYNGVQHYVFPNFTNCSYEDFLKTVRRDQFKRTECDRNGVYLITVPYTIKHDKIREYIINHLPKSARSETE
jgi:hypothetical protein